MGRVVPMMLVMGKGAVIVLSGLLLLISGVISDCSGIRKAGAQNKPMAKLNAPTSSYDSRVTLKP
jgi:hypothetical protein